MTRKEIAVRFLEAMISTQDGLNAISESALAHKLDPFVYAAKAALKFADALLGEMKLPKKPRKKKPVQEIEANPQ